MVARLVLAEPENVAILVEVWHCGGAAAWPGAVRATRLSADLLGAGRSRRLAPWHRPCPLPLLQVLMPIQLSAPFSLPIHIFRLTVL